MINIQFKNLKKSDLARQVVIDKLDPFLKKFPELEHSGLAVTLSMDNSPRQAGPDLYRVRFNFQWNKSRGIILEKSARNVYEALAKAIDRLHERVSRQKAKDIGRKRAGRRKIKRDHFNTNFPHQLPDTA